MAATPYHDWYLAEWLETLRLKQADLARLTDWDKRKVSHLVSGKQPYRRDEVNEAAFALNIQPFELLMPPERAMALRQLYASSLTIAAETQSPYVAEPPADPISTIRKSA
ncbi:CI repressor [Microcystis phage Mae-JY04]|uniref:helix-turn-helix domain-containing protein n=1 Tax=Blastomonas sp. TaxID=1909299 RepID=UPI002587FFF7|nr:helix-turn-helix transcriptional regulator [Blastomonas sp.]